jgi:hypothetical protein
MLGSLGLLRSLSALGRAAPKTAAERMASAKFIKRSMKRLLPSDQQFLRELIDRQNQAVKNAREERDAQIAMFFAQYLPEPVNYKKEKEVVAAFVMGADKSHAGLKSDGMSLTVNGKEVAKREQTTSRFVTVCPGKFGEDKTSRRAANAALDILGAGLRVGDRAEPGAIPGRDEGGHAFLHPKGHPGRVVSDNRCYQVEVNSKIRSAAVRSLTPFANVEGPYSLVPPKVSQASVKADLFPGKAKLTKKEQAEVKRAWKALQKERKAASKAAASASKAAKKAQLARQASMREEISERAGDMAGLGRYHRRRR